MYFIIRTWNERRIVFDTITLFYIVKHFIWLDVQCSVYIVYGVAYKQKIQWHVKTLLAQSEICIWQQCQQSEPEMNKNNKLEVSEQPKQRTEEDWRRSSGEWGSVIIILVIVKFIFSWLFCHPIIVQFSQEPKPYRLLLSV